MLDDELAHGVEEGMTTDAVRMHSQMDAMRAKGSGLRAMADLPSESSVLVRATRSRLLRSRDGAAE